MIFNGPSSEKLVLERISPANCQLLKQQLPSELTLLWIKAASKIIVDGRGLELSPDQLICMTEFHRLEVDSVPDALMIRFNRAFFCILDHDSAVGCKGILFFGSSQLPILNLSETDIAKLEALTGVFAMEMNEESDPLQLEMLQMLLKRLLILCTRIFKAQEKLESLDPMQTDLVRDYNYLVEVHFRQKHTVAAYADLLAKSPKTLSNLFSKLGEKSPLTFIQDRIMLEARRLIGYSDKSIKEIGYELGYEDIQAFSRFSKKNEGLSPSEFKENLRMGKIANSSGKWA
ncbi:MAG: helix-turn-helix domain-containing protein [Algoriphagus sp.]|uniref:helix-turn-helix domain-containing protein n=1 Tax=Algoriphagus sp. TaxID=1872435 RepID=UPI0026135B56|nr:helix-turn-helix domain-containing protein [Algoriphagus sp.]MDG1277609.1 helix-turn-helix domain-containing protein [Algoriphagus sp.]